VRLILASASPRRRALLTSAGFTFDVLPVSVDESIRSGEPPAEYVRRVAAAKSSHAIHASVKPDGLVVLSADTAVVVDGAVLGKPRSDDEAAEMLKRLSGRAHQVMTGVSVRTASHEAGCVETTTVWVSPLTPAEIDWYLATGEGRDKAGAYAVQGIAARFIPRIEGSYSNVVGLPISVLPTLFAELGLDDGVGCVAERAKLC
jgi:septum formation protein